MPNGRFEMHRLYDGKTCWRPGDCNPLLERAADSVASTLRISNHKLLRRGHLAGRVVSEMPAITAKIAQFQPGALCHKAGAPYHNVG